MGKVTQKLYKIGYDNINIELDLFSLLCSLTDDEKANTSVNIRPLDDVRVAVSHPNVSGVEHIKEDLEGDMRAAKIPCYFHKGDPSMIDIYLLGLCAGTHNVYVTARFGTQTRVIYRGVVVVANNPSSEENQDVQQEEIIVCETYSNEPFDPTDLEQAIAGKADGSVYMVNLDEDRKNAEIYCNFLGVFQGGNLVFGIDRNEITLYNGNASITFLTGDLINAANVSRFMKQVEVFDSQGITKVFSQPVLINMTWGDMCNAFPEVFYYDEDGYVHNAENHSEALCDNNLMVILTTARVDDYSSYLFTENY